jgi:hypothetical protein
MPDWNTLQDFFYLHRGFYIGRKTAREMERFLPCYFELLQKGGIYLSDVPFKDLTPEARQRIIFNAYQLWTKERV